MSINLPPPPTTAVVVTWIQLTHTVIILIHKKIPVPHYNIMKIILFFSLWLRWPAITGAMKIGHYKNELALKALWLLIVWCCLMVFGHVWQNLKAIKHSIKQLLTFLLFSCLIGDVLFIWTAESIMFSACMHTTLAQRLVSTVWSVFDQTCFQRLATHFTISIRGGSRIFFRRGTPLRNDVTNTNKPHFLQNTSCIRKP